MKRSPWLKLRKKTDPEFPLEPPIRLGNFSNGEMFHEQTPLERKIRKEILQQADDKSRKLGMDRREFLASAMGMATSLYVLNLAAACSSSDGAVGGSGGMGAGGLGGAPGGGGVGPSGGVSGNGGFPGSGGSSAGGAFASGGAGGAGGASGGSSGAGSGGVSSGGGGGSGGYAIPPDATMDCARAEDILNGKGEFIFDIQTHHIDTSAGATWRQTNPGHGSSIANFFALYNGCGAFDKIDCVDAQSYLEKVFLESDTTVAVLSGFPAPLCTDGRTTGCGNALDNDAMVRSRDRMNDIARSRRVVNHCQVNPNDHLDLQLAIMDRIKSEHGVWGWKVYPEWGPTGAGYYLDDPKYGIPMIEKARSLGVKTVCIHKGIVFPGWDAGPSHPRDVGVVAQRYPDTSFIVYHSAIELGAGGEGVYNPNNTMGTDRLCRTVSDAGLYGKNVYAELGSVWFQVMNNPVMAQHVIGKLLKYVGPDNVLWGSECVWYGSPQPQIEAFRAFQISQEFQQQYGYPALTPALKAKIFGLNAARIYGIDPNATRCRVTETQFAQLKEIMDGELGARRWSFQDMGGPRTWREFWNLAKQTNGRPG